MPVHAVKAYGVMEIGTIPALIRNLGTNGAEFV